MGKFGKFLHDACNFKFLIVEKILQALYIFFTALVILVGFFMLFCSDWSGWMGGKGILLMILGPRRLLGAWFLQIFDTKLVMTWYAGIFAASIVAFPLMYRTARGAFENFDQTLAYAGQTLGLSNTYMFWHIRMPACRQGILAGTVLAFARALGEYGATSMVAGYTPGRTATISTTVYQLWRTDNDALAFKWVLVNVVISAVVLLAVNLLEKGERASRTGKKRKGGR
ncbi:MAG: ABC transporter permease subunit [Lachnospiraceae bacterium]|nr:ABC transporter permease subunit [Lachnospiraceae bacterium]